MFDSSTMETKSTIISNYPVMAGNFPLSIKYNVNCCELLTGCKQGDIIIYVDGEKKDTFKVQGEGNIDYFISVAGLADGSHTITVECKCSNQGSKHEGLKFELNRTKTIIYIRDVENNGVYSEVTPLVIVTGLGAVKTEVRLTKNGVVVPYQMNTTIREEGDYQLYAKAIGDNGLYDQKTINFKIEKN